MSDAKKCDYCGCFYEIETIDHQSIELKLGDKKIDLCQDCYTDIVGRSVSESKPASKSAVRNRNAKPSPVKCRPKKSLGKGWSEKRRAKFKATIARKRKSKRINNSKAADSRDRKRSPSAPIDPGAFSVCLCCGKSFDDPLYEGSDFCPACHELNNNSRSVTGNI